MLRWLEKRPNNTLTIAWCPGPKDIPGNDQADQLAKQATSLTSLSEPTTLRLARDSKTAGTPVEGLLPITRQLVNSQPDSTISSTPPHFLELADNRELYGRLLQCRTGHGYIGEYYQRFVPSADPTCPCDETTQTREHIIQYCPTYERFRTILRQASQTLYLLDLLGTKDGIQAMTSFLEQSGAFTKSPSNPNPNTTSHCRQTPYRLHRVGISNLQPTRITLSKHLPTRSNTLNSTITRRRPNYYISSIHTSLGTIPADHPCSLGVVSSVPLCNAPTASQYLFACCGI